MLRELGHSRGARSITQLVDHAATLTDDFEEPKVARVLVELEGLGLAHEMSEDVPYLVELRRTAVPPPRPLPVAACAVIRPKIEGGTAVEKNVPVAEEATTEQVLPARVQEALGELAGAAQEGLLALSVGVGLRETADLLCDRARRSTSAPTGSCVRANRRVNTPAVSGFRDAGRLFRRRLN